MKACPFCGNEQVTNQVVPNTNGNRRYMHCPECSASGPWNKGNDSEMLLWNKRTPLAEGEAKDGWVQGKKSHPTEYPATATSVGDKHLYLYAANGLIYHFPPKEDKSGGMNPQRKEE